MSLITEAMDRANRSRELSRLDAQLASSRRSIGMGQAIAGSSGSATSLSFGRYSQSMAHHADQYGFYVGYPYAIIHAIANRLAAQPIRVGKLLPVGTRPKRGFGVKSKEFLPKSIQDLAGRIEIYPEHRIHRAINNPNQMMVRHHLLYMTFASLEITGRGYWWMFKDPETGKDQIWPVPSHWIEPYHEKDKLFAYYRVMLPGTGEPIKVPTKQIVPFFHPDPSDPFAALAPMQANSRAVMTDFAIEMAQRMSFENGINPGLAIMVGKPNEFAGVNQEQMTLTEAQRAQIVGAVRKQYRGVTRFDEPMILDALIKDVKQITTSPREMAYKESSILARNRLTQGWGMNPITLGEIEGVNYASSGVADHHVCRNVFLPRTEANSQTMTCYVPPYLSDGEDLLIFQEPVQPSDPELELKREGDYLDRGVYSRNEVRQAHGKEPVEGGDHSFVQGTGPGSGWVPVGGDPQDNPGDPDNSGQPVENETPDERTARIAKKKANKAKGKAKPGRPFLVGPNGEWNWHSLDQLDWRLRFKSEAECKAYVVKTANVFDILQRAAEKDWHTQLLPVFARLGAQAAAKLREHVGKNSHVSPTEAAHVAISRHRWEAELSKELESVIFAAALSGAAGEWRAFRDSQQKKSFLHDLPRRVIDAAKDIAQKVMERGIVRTIVDGTIDAVRRAVRRGVKDGDTGIKLADRVASEVLVGTGAEKAAARVTRNEAVHTVNQGQQAIRNDLARAGKIAFTQWVTQHDGDVRNSHRALDGHKKLPGSPFSMTGKEGTFQCYYPGDPSLPPGLRCNCRCKLVTVYAVPKIGGR